MKMVDKIKNIYKADFLICHYKGEAMANAEMIAKAINKR